MEVYMFVTMFFIVYDPYYSPTVYPIINVGPKMGRSEWWYFKWTKIFLSNEKKGN